MRHSERLDDVSEDFASIPASIWPDKTERPYDTPISNTDLPREAAMKLRKYAITKVVSSPFRRCLQTAGIVVWGI